MSSRACPDFQDAKDDATARKRPEILGHPRSPGGACLVSRYLSRSCNVRAVGVARLTFGKLMLSKMSTLVAVFSGCYLQEWVSGFESRRYSRLTILEL